MIAGKLRLVKEYTFPPIPTPPRVNQYTVRGQERDLMIISIPVFLFLLSNSSIKPDLRSQRLLK